MNIFSSLREYAGKWSVKDSRNFTEEEVNTIASAEIVASQFGNSVCFHLKNGGMSFIPVDANSTCNVGDSVDMKSVKLITLQKSGESDIVRVSLLYSTYYIR